MGEEKKGWVSPYVIANYGALTWFAYSAMKDFAKAFSDPAAFVRPSDMVQDLGEVGGSDLFIPIVCACSAIPLIIHFASHIRHRWTVRARWFRERGQGNSELSADWARKLVDSGWQDTLQPLDMVSASLDTSHQDRGCDELRQEQIPPVDNIIPFADKTRKSRKNRNR